LFIAIYKVLYYTCPKRRYRGKKKIKRFFRSEQKKIFWNEIIGILIQGFIGMVISGLLGLSNKISFFEMETIGERMSYITAIVCLAGSFILLPYFFWILMRTPLEEVRTVGFKKKYGLMYEDIKPRDRLILTFYILFVLKRFTYVLNAFTVYS